MAEKSVVRVVTLEIENGTLTSVKIDGEEACEVDDKTREQMFSADGPHYLGTVLYHVDPVKQLARICVHKRCKLVCG